MANVFSALATCLFSAHHKLYTHHPDSHSPVQFVQGRARPPQVLPGDHHLLPSHSAGLHLLVWDGFLEITTHLDLRIPFIKLMMGTPVGVILPSEFLKITNFQTWIARSIVFG